MPLIRIGILCVNHKSLTIQVPKKTILQYPLHTTRCHQKSTVFTESVCSFIHLFIFLLWMMPTCADEAGVPAVDQVVVVGQNERTTLLDLPAVLVARYLVLAGLLGGGEILSTQPGLVGHLSRRKRGGK